MVFLILFSFNYSDKSEGSTSSDSDATLSEMTLERTKQPSSNN